MNNLYPLKFNPSIHSKIWGGNKLHKLLNKKDIENAGESWEISGVDSNVSIVSNGYLKGNSLEELIEVYMGDIVGDKIYQKFGLEFPLLIKFIDANNDLSIQVHPDDKMAFKHHKTFGKTEMWYVIDADSDTKICYGFNQKISKEDVENQINNNTITSILNFIEIKKNDAIFVPAGTVHAIGKGALIAEIQQTSNITYRLFDFNRIDKNGNTRELHINKSSEAIDYNFLNNKKIDYYAKKNTPCELIKCQYFTTNIIDFNSIIDKDIYGLDSFVIYICVDGSMNIHYNNENFSISKGETILIPASCHQYKLKPLTSSSKALEVYIENI